ncbi:MAG: HSP20 family small heat-shock protein [Betaproteobacteria bacterium]|nr:HSP20 family small heat-shock protein [Betaproteobacteria bacterium]
MNNRNLSIFTTGSLLEPFSSYLQSPAAGAMPVDVEDSKSEWRIKADLPGFARQDVKVKLDDDILSIKASHVAQPGDEDDAENDNGIRYLISERSCSSLERKFRLAAGIDNAAISASLKDGVLTVTVPKPNPGSNGREIDVN